MIYQIQTKNDLTKGVTLVVSVPENDVDKKALYTLLSDTPEFVLPFTYRSIDGMYEFTYQVGTRSKMVYLAGNRGLVDYSDMWIGLLKPLLDCGDWFMKPFSFVLKYDHIYCDKNSKAPAYIYIPTLPDCCNYDELISMVAEVAKQNNVTDVVLENKVLRILQDFQLQTLLDVIVAHKSSGLASIPKASMIQQSAPLLQSMPETPVPNIPKQATNSTPQSAQPISNQQRASVGSKDDIAINLNAGVKAKKQPKPPKPTKPAKPGLFSRFKKSKSEPTIVGGSALSIENEPMNHPHQPAQSLNNPLPHYNPYPFDDDGGTILEDMETGLPKLRYVGTKDHPRFIDVSVAINSVFTIGRHDVSVGIRQSDFEFDKKTKGVGRRHAAIERNAEGYNLVDLNSQAGTFVDGQRLIPNIPIKLGRGQRVSFGNLGADYLWEE